jgi:hypothetical protein
MPSGHVDRSLVMRIESSHLRREVLTQPVDDPTQIRIRFLVAHWFHLPDLQVANSIPLPTGLTLRRSCEVADLADSLLPLSVLVLFSSNF